MSAERDVQEIAAIIAYSIIMILAIMTFMLGFLGWYVLIYGCYGF